MGNKLYVGNLPYSIRDNDLQQLFAQRDPLYREVADLVIDGGRINAQGVMQLLIKEFGDRWNH